MYCACFYRQIPQGKLGSFRKRGAIKNSLFWLTLPYAMPQDFSPHPQCAQAQQDLALSCSWKGGSGLPAKAGGGQVSVWHCPALCTLQPWPSLASTTASLHRGKADGKLAAFCLPPPALCARTSNKPVWDGG